MIMHLRHSSIYFRQTDTHTDATDNITSSANAGGNYFQANSKNKPPTDFSQPATALHDSQESWRELERVGESCVMPLLEPSKSIFFHILTTFCPHFSICLSICPSLNVILSFFAGPAFSHLFVNLSVSQYNAKYSFFISGPALHDSQESWRELCYALIGALVVITLFAFLYIVISQVLHRRRMMKHATQMQG